MSVFITKCDKKRKFHKFQNNYYKVLQKIIKKCDRFYKPRQNRLQSIICIIKCDKRLL